VETIDLGLINDEKCNFLLRIIIIKLNVNIKTIQLAGFIWGMKVINNYLENILIFKVGLHLKIHIFLFYLNYLNINGEVLHIHFLETPLLLLQLIKTLLEKL